VGFQGHGLRDLYKDKQVLSVCEVDIPSGMGREPLLHATIFDLIRMVKNAECRAGFTTNGIK
jgi:MoaA/NifB/PqqE/SkfB family radical SAM enzyme